MRAMWAVMKRELNAVLRDRTMIIAILIQLFIASFSSALLIGLLSLYDPDSAGIYANIRFPVALVRPQGGNSEIITADMEALSRLLSERGLRPQTFSSLEQALQAMDNGQVRAILAPPADQEMTQSVEPPGISISPGEMRLYLPGERALASVILNILQRPLQAYENLLRERRGAPVHYTNLPGRPPTTYEFIYTVIIPILMLFPAFVAGGMTVDSLAEEVENHTLETLLSAPLTLHTVVWGKAAAALSLAVIQCIAWLGLLRLNGVTVQAAPLVLLLALISSGILSMGAAITALVFRDRERSQFVFSLSLLAASGLSIGLGVSPVTALARLSSGSYPTPWLFVRDMTIFGGALIMVVYALERVIDQVGRR